MKKLIILFSSVIVALAVSSCKKDPLAIDPDTLDNYAYKCWYVTALQTISGNQVSSSWYEWNTERALVISLQKNKDIPGYSASYRIETKYAGQSVCEAANEKDK